MSVATKTKSAPRRRVADEKIIALNSLGLSLRRIAKALDIHYTTVRNRLDALGIEPFDTRRAFMGEIYDSLNEDQVQWLLDELGPNFNVQDLVKKLITDRYFREIKSQ